jgi:hypothetical protein
MDDAAVIAPVILKHLSSALEKSKFQFGTDAAAATINKIRNILISRHVDIYICDGSKKDKLPVVTWRAVLEEISEESNPDLRPESTLTDTPFAYYFTVSNLYSLPENKWMFIDRFWGVRKKDCYQPDYNPRKPTLVRLI